MRLDPLVRSQGFCPALVDQPRRPARRAFSMGATAGDALQVLQVTLRIRWLSSGACFTIVMW